MTRATKMVAAGVLGVAGLLMLLIFVFNLLAGIVGGIWLLCLGQWHIVLGGLIAAIVTHTIYYTIASIPLVGLMALVSFFYRKKSRLGVAFIGLIAGLFDSLLVVGWLALVFIYFLKISFENDITLLPILLFAYGVAATPIISMSRGEDPNNQNTNLTIAIVVIGSILVVILSLLGLPLIYPVVVLVILMIIKTLAMTVLIVSEMSKKQESGQSAEAD